MAVGSRFQEVWGTSGVHGQSPGGSLGAFPQKQNLSFRFMKRIIYFAYLVHFHALIFPVFVLHFKTK